MPIEPSLHYHLLLSTENITKDILGLRISEGMSPGTFRDIINKMIRERPLVLNIDEVVGAVEFEYTFWAKPDNTSAVRQNLIGVSQRSEMPAIASRWCQSDHFNHSEDESNSVNIKKNF